MTEKTDEPIIAHWPGDWPGRNFVNLDCVGDPGDWIDLQIPSAEEILFGDPNDEERAIIFADAYIAAGRELAFPLPTDYGMSEEKMHETAVEDFLGFIREWRKRTLAERELARDHTMTGAAPNAAWNLLKDFGFTPDAEVISDLRPGLSFDFGSFKLSASAVMGEYFQPVVLFTGVLARSRTLAEISFEIPRETMPRELVAALVVWNLDRVSPGRRFSPEREVTWLELGRQNQHRLPWEITRAERAKEAAEYAARPHCTVNRSVLKLALKTLAEQLMQAPASDPVVVSFDGRVLSFLCHGVETVVGAAGQAWSCPYCLEVKRLTDKLPKRLMSQTVEVGVWKSMLEIGRNRYKGLEKIQPHV